MGEGNTISRRPGGTIMFFELGAFPRFHKPVSSATNPVAAPSMAALEAVATYIGQAPSNYFSPLAYCQ